jgi:hypothetical protein
MSDPKADLVDFGNVGGGWLSANLELFCAVEECHKSGASLRGSQPSCGNNSKGMAHHAQRHSPILTLLKWRIRPCHDSRAQFKFRHCGDVLLQSKVVVCSVLSIRFNDQDED